MQEKSKSVLYRMRVIIHVIGGRCCWFFANRYAVWVRHCIWLGRSSTRKIRKAISRPYNSWNWRQKIY